ncbi:hypothetical protein ACRRTK_016850 [Alexandromys fortis]
MVSEEWAIEQLSGSNYQHRQRLPPKNVYYYRCPDHRKNYVMSFAFCFDREDDIYQFAYCYPYTYTRFQHYLDSLQKRNMDYFFREQLGQSVSWCQLAHTFNDSKRDLLDDSESLEFHQTQRKGKLPEEKLRDGCPLTSDSKSSGANLVTDPVWAVLLKELMDWRI